MALEQVTSNVFAATKWRGCNPGYVLTEGGIVSIDSPQLPSDAVAMREEMRAKGRLVFRINTEHHIDHVFGQHYFADQGPLIAHADIREGFWKPVRGRDPYDVMLEIVQKDDPQGLAIMPAKGVVRIGSPDITFRDRLTLTAGEHVFELIHTPGHTKGQLAVFVPKERVAFVGDTIFAECQTWLHAADPDRWLQSLALIATLDVDRIVPGHGPVCDKSYIVKQSAFIREWVAAVAAGMAKGWSKSECAERISFLGRCPVDIGQESAGPMVQRLNVERLYDHLSGVPA
jgi:cyclase